MIEPESMRVPAGCRSREGAWIEMRRDFKFYNENTVAPVRERGLKSSYPHFLLDVKFVAPVRERGLKSLDGCVQLKILESLP